MNSSGRSVLETHAAEAASTLRDVERVMWQAAYEAQLGELVAETARVCGAQLDLPPLPAPHPVAEASQPAGSWRDRTDLSPRWQLALGFAEQFSCDVSGIGDGERAALFTELGMATGAFAQATYVVDFFPRLRGALDAMFGPSDWPAPPAIAAGPAPDLWNTLDQMVRVVPRLEALDPVTTEIVRLRGARQHQCRICQSLRSRPALLAGAGDDEFAAIDHYADSDLLPLHRAALAFTDAVIWTPGHLDPGMLTTLADQFTPAQRVELVLDITRNALNKVAVATKTDDPHVTEGYEIYDIEANGDLVYGLTLA